LDFKVICSVVDLAIVYLEPRLSRIKNDGFVKSILTTNVCSIKYFNGALYINVWASDYSLIQTLFKNKGVRITEGLCNGIVVAFV